MVPALAACWLLTLRAAGGPSGRAAASLTPAAAYDTAVARSRAGRHRQSLPYYRRALTGSHRNDWIAHYNYGGALYNVGLEVRSSHGLPLPALHTSIERVALMRDALVEFDEAERLARAPRDRATVILGRAERLEIWGFPFEAFIELRRAQWTDSARKELGRTADGYMMMIEHPERPWKPGDPLPLPAAAELPPR